MGQLEENIALIKGERNEGGNTKERIAETFEMLASELENKMEKDDSLETLKSNVSITEVTNGPIPPANEIEKYLHFNISQDVDWFRFKAKGNIDLRSEESGFVFQTDTGVSISGNRGLSNRFSARAKNVAFEGDETGYFTAQRYENIRLSAKNFVSITTPDFKINDVDILKKINALEDTINKLQEEINSLKRGN